MNTPFNNQLSNKAGQNIESLCCEIESRLVTRDETALVDWLAFTIKTKHCVDDQKALLSAITSDFNIPKENWQRPKTGWNGYTHRINLSHYGLVAYGGHSQKNTIHIELNAQGCSLVKDWFKVYDWLVLNKARLTRVDLAHDDFYGKTVNIEVCKQWYIDKLFNTTGRPPKAQLIDDLDDGSGKTFYVGTRKSGKLVRMYEKGKQLGYPNSDWFRVELELHDKGRVIPTDIILKAGSYLAGSYKAFEFISTKQDRVKTIQKTTTMTYEKTKEWVKTACGKSLNAILQVEGGDLSKLYELTVREGLPKRLAPLEHHFPESVSKKT